jgi:aconitate hydratase
MLPFVVDEATAQGFALGDRIIVPGMREAISSGAAEVKATLVHGGAVSGIILSLPGLEAGEREIILAGCLMNYYGKK